ncbi:MAG: hypothetical protein F6J87_00940 [Spirulina sp. SIO3F2]|nr:hypothetical protein [Spirulina sp. SIO3F2]
MVNWGYRAARLRGKFTRWWYEQRSQSLTRRPLPSAPQLNASIYTLSCQRDFPEQVACLRSFLTFVGVPQQFVIISDGSYTLEASQQLERIHPCVQVVQLLEFANPELPPPVFDYMRSNSMGKKLLAILSIPISGTTVYTDSDIFFFPGAKALAELLQTDDGQSYYLPDNDPAFDLRILNPGEEAKPINGGFIVFKQQPDWQEVMNRFLALSEPPNYFTEQTMMHLTLHRLGAKPLERDRYIMGREDEFMWRDRYAETDIVLRHYVTPVRHKFWGNWRYLR